MLVITMYNFIKALEAICAEAITDPKIFKKFDRLLTTDFVNIVGKNYNVITIKSRHPEIGSTSKYIYVFDEPKGVHKINDGELQSIVHLTNEISHTNADPDKLAGDVKRIENFARRNLITLNKDSAGNISRVRLNNCVLIIRLADHELSIDADDQQIRSFNFRKNLIDSLYYYNVDEVGKNFEFTVDKAVYCSFKKGKERIIYEFTNKMKAAGLPEYMITEVIRKVNNIFR